VNSDDEVIRRLSDAERRLWKPEVLLTSGQGSMPVVKSHTSVVRDLLRSLVAERQLADALAEQLRGRAPHNGYEKDVLARHARLRGKT